MRGFFIYIEGIKNLIRLIISHKIGTMTSEGSMFIVFKSLIFKIDSPELKIKIPPTIESSLKKFCEIYSPKNKLTA